MKAKLRAWLIDLVREAIRSERVQPGNTYSLVSEGTWLMPDNPATSGVTIKRKSQLGPITVGLPITPSFEQMQESAIAEQQKYYEVKK